MPLARPFAQIDVFSAVPCAGNPVAVVLDGQGVDAAAITSRAALARLPVTRKSELLARQQAARAAGGDVFGRIY